MQGDRDTGSQRGAIGTSQQVGNITYGFMPEQVTNKLKENPGAEFIVVQRVRQGEQPTIWASGDPAQTKDLFQHAFDTLGLKEPART